MSVPNPTFQPSSESIQQAENIEYTKKARHGHGKDVTDQSGVRQVAGCLPIDPVNRRFLLVSSRKKAGAWVIPKGGWEEDETQEHAALRETWEEAGIKGNIIRQIGIFQERKKKGVKAHHWIFELEISEVVKKFPEKKKRERRWFTYDEALIATKSAYLHDAIRLSSLNPAITSPPNNNPSTIQDQSRLSNSSSSGSQQQQQQIHPPSPPPPLPPSQQQQPQFQQQQQQPQFQQQQQPQFQQQQPPPLQEQPPPLQQQQNELPPSPPHVETGKKSLGKQLKSLFQVKK